MKFIKSAVNGAFGCLYQFLRCPFLKSAAMQAAKKQSTAFLDDPVAAATFNQRRFAQRRGDRPTAGVIRQRLPTPRGVGCFIQAADYAATTQHDLERFAFRGWAFLILPWQKDFPPLCLKHDTSRTVGRIERLSYDAKGNLKIKAVVTDRKATRYGAFSVGGRVDAHHIENADNAGFCAGKRQFWKSVLPTVHRTRRPSSRGVTASCRRLRSNSTASPKQPSTPCVYRKSKP